MTARRRIKRKAARRRGGGRARRPRRDPLARERALEALSLMRSRDLSLTRAAKAAGTTRETMLKYVSPALKRTSSGRYAAKPSDRLTRHVWMLTPDGKREVVVRSSRTASRIAEHAAAVDAHLRSLPAADLEPFRGKFVRSRGEQIPFLTDPSSLERLAQAGEVSFERLYVQRS